MSESRVYRNALPIGAMLAEYRLESVLGAGGFGMTYLGWDTHLEKHVAIKEYLPIELSVRALDGSVVPISTGCEHDYKWGLERFIQEARTLAKFSHPHIVRVNRYFEANATGYMVMDYEKGEPLNQVLKREQPNEPRLKEILMPLLDGLQAVHSAGFLHRDIKPGNIFLRDNGSPVLIDFGAARQAIGGATKSLTSVLTPGYAPLEQYSSDGHQGPWSDIYAMGGVLYRALANDNPPDAVSRMRNDVVPGKLGAAMGRASAPFLKAVEWAMTLDEKRRPQSVQEWRRALRGEAAAPAPAADIASAPTQRPGMAAASIATAPTQRLPGGPPPSQPSRPPRKPPEEPRSGRGWMGIVVLLLIGAVIAGVWNKQRTARERERQEMARVEAERASAAREEAERAAGERLAAQRRALDQRAEEIEAARRIEEERRLVASDRPGPRPDGPPAPASFRERPGRERDDRPPGHPGDFQDRMRQGAEQDFRSADGNGDGYLSRDEAQERFPFVAREFHRIDRDGDGRISPQEFVDLRRAQAEQHVKKKKW
jgi:serine/threonine protein kinase